MKLIDRTDLLNGLMRSGMDPGWGDTASDRADAVRQPEARLPASRDFR